MPLEKQYCLAKEVIVDSSGVEYKEKRLIRKLPILTLLESELSI